MQMSRFSSTFIALAFLIAIIPATGQAADDLKVEVSLNRDSIGLDEQAILEVVVSGASRNLPAPQMPTLPMFEIYSQGSSSSISIVNNRVSSSVTYRYILLPKKPGTFPIDQIAVVYDNQRYKGNRLELTVLDQGQSATPHLEEKAVDRNGKSRDYFLQVVVDEDEPYVNEQVTLTLKFCTAVQYIGSPELSEPTTTGFWTEVLGNKTPYQQKITGRTYKIIERKYALFPTQTGELTIGRATIRFSVATRRKRVRDPFSIFGNFFGTSKVVSASSQPLTINVKPLPPQGRPDDFTGTIGNFRINATINKNQVEVNQPVTVTIKISGTGNIKSVAEPPIPEMEDFRIYRASSSENINKLNDRLGGTKVFEEVFIPRRPGRLEIPALSFNFFDPEHHRYRTLTTRPLPITVTKPEGYVASPEVPYGGPDITIGSQARDIRFIKEKIGSTAPVGRLLILTPLYILVNGLPVLALAALVLIRRHRDKLAKDIGYARSRQAGKLARKRLARARSMAFTDRTGEFYAEIHSALSSYMADKFNLSPHGLTTERIAELLQTGAADQTLVANVTDLMARCDYARFAPSASSQEAINRDLSQAEQIMISIEGMKLG